MEDGACGHSAESPTELQSEPGLLGGNTGAEAADLQAKELAFPEDRPGLGPSGLVTECLAGVELGVLGRHRAELGAVERETGARIVERPGLYGCTVLVTGPKTAVQQAWPRVAKLLLCPGAASCAEAAAEEISAARPPISSPPGLGRPAAVAHGQLSPPICSPPGLSRPAEFTRGGSFGAAEEVEMPLAPLQTSSEESSPSERTVQRRERAHDPPVEGSAQPVAGISSCLQMALQAALQEANREACDDSEEAPAPTLDEADEAGADRATPSASAAKRKKRLEKKRAQKAAAEADDAAMAVAAEAAALAPLDFTLPAPLPLEGVKSRKRQIFHLENVSYYYAEKGSKTAPTLTACSLSLSQASRVLVTGAKGAGKTTVAKLLANVFAPSAGSVRRVAGLHVAHLSRESLDQMERHSARTVEQYCAWLSSCAWRRIGGKYDGAEDFEALAQCPPSGPEGVEWGEHLRAFGLDPGWTSRAKVAALSAASKAGVLLAAAFWPRPQLLVLDDPASWLDSAAVEALSQAAASFKGGVVITCHSKYQERFEAIATEKWTLRGGRLRPDSPAEQPAPEALGQSSADQAKIQQELKSLIAQLTDKEKMSWQTLKEANERLEVLLSMLKA